MTRPLGRLLLLEVARINWSPALELLLKRSEPAGLFFKELATVRLTLELTRKCARALGPASFLAVRDQGKGPLCDLFGASADPERLASRGDEAAKALGDLLGQAMGVAGL